MNILFVGDPNLGPQGFEIVRRRFPLAETEIWARGDQAKACDIKNRILARRWDVLLSFYNDLIFPEEHLLNADIALNIHPSSPSLRGVGYDTLPLILGHQYFGATLHFLTREIDSGPIIDVIEESMPVGINQSEFRIATQRLCLQMLEKTVALLSRSRETTQILHILKRCSEQTDKQWNSDYISRDRLKSILDDLRIVQPGHCVFR